GLQPTFHVVNGLFLLLEIGEIDENADTNHRIVRPLNVFRRQQVIVKETVVGFTDRSAGALDHVFREVEGIDVLNLGSKAPRGKAVAATNLKDAHGRFEVPADIIIFELALKDVHDVDFNVASDTGSAAIPMQVCGGLGHHCSASPQAAALRPTTA